MDFFSFVFGHTNMEDKKPDDDHQFLEGNLDTKHSHSFASLDLLNSYGKGLRMNTRKEETMVLSNDNICNQKLSVDEILRAGGERFIHFSTNKVDGISMFIHPYESSISDTLSMDDDAKDVQLVHLLLDAAEKLATKRFDLATKHISACLDLSSQSGSPIQRVSFYFARALMEKINRDSGGIVMKKINQRMKGLALGTNNTFLATHQELPFAQVMQFAAIQTIIEHVKASGKMKIHLIDLQIRSGIQWTALMQGLAEFAITGLKITAVGTSDQLYIEETGKRLMSFAKSLNFPFSFKVVFLKEMSELKEDLLNVEADETLSVYSYQMLRSMISRPDSFDSVMRAITRMRPDLMVVIEVEANHNSPSFVDRFIEALLFYSAYFDCLEDCMDGSNECRRVLESSYFGEGIMNIVAAEGEERVSRNVKLDVWRAFFRSYGMREIELSESSRYQASLVLKQFEHGNSCTLESNGKGLIVGWKGTPFASLTAWKFL